jgi:hypothetical protein
MCSLAHSIYDAIPSGEPVTFRSDVSDFLVLASWHFAFVKADAVRGSSTVEDWSWIELRGSRAHTAGEESEKKKSEWSFRAGSHGVSWKERITVV